LKITIFNIGYILRKLREAARLSHPREASSLPFKDKHGGD